MLEILFASVAAALSFRIFSLYRRMPYLALILSSPYFLTLIIS
jgi:hypothetical protein